MLADQLLTGAPPEVWALWNTLRLELNAGQLLDIIGSVRRERRIDKAERIARYKSGKYTIERPLHLGALLAAPERGADLLPALSGYGLPLGDAFQMRDDVIGAFGDPAVTGKPVGDDLREGKPTPLLARAVARATPAQQARARPRRAAGPDRRRRRRHPERSSSRPAPSPSSRRSSTPSPAQAVAALDRVDLDDPAPAELVALADYVVRPRHLNRGSAGPYSGRDAHIGSDGAGAARRRAAVVAAACSDESGIVRRRRCRRSSRRARSPRRRR